MGRTFSRAAFTQPSCLWQLKDIFALWGSEGKSSGAIGEELELSLPCHPCRAPTVLGQQPPPSINDNISLTLGGSVTFLQGW